MADAGRVIAGTARGIRLEAPGPGTRPLADRVKQTLFAILEPDLPGARVLDLFAGSGAAGIEALSRGAASVTFVEHVQTTIRWNRGQEVGAACGQLAAERAGEPPAPVVARRRKLLVEASAAALRGERSHDAVPSGVGD